MIVYFKEYFEKSVWSSYYMMVWNDEAIKLSKLPISSSKSISWSNILNLLSGFPCKYSGIEDMSFLSLSSLNPNVMKFIIRGRILSFIFLIDPHLLISELG